jgi:hypothetical protein
LDTLELREDRIVQFTLRSGVRIPYTPCLMMRIFPTLLLLGLGLAIATGCGGGGGSSFGGGASTAVSPSTSATSGVPGASTGVRAQLVLEFGDAVTKAVQQRITQLATQASLSRTVAVLASSATPAALPAGSLVLGFGDTVATRSLISVAEVSSLASEGFIVRQGQAFGTTVLATDGKPLGPDPFALGVNQGVLYGSYALLQDVGFGFLHPLAPVVPGDVTAPTAPVDTTASPRWPVRGIHIHTQHPIELCELLNGWGKGDPNDATSWNDMLPEWDSFLEWAIANRLNRVEWFLLSAASWQTFASSSERQARLATLVQHAHEWGIAAGADMPIAEQQQHAWYMVDASGSVAQGVAAIDSRVTWAVQAGFDFFSTELGTSEFTSTGDTSMVAWLNELTSAASAQGKRAYVKAHCSTGQTAPDYADPFTGGTLNYNFLAAVCDPRLGVYPHTVEVYGLDDPAPTYGNTDFGYMRTFMEEEAGLREVIFHPETAYWVTYDANVPLFLPVYGERRLHDLRLIAQDEDQGLVGRGALAGSRINGQVYFSSGWEWGYWLNDVLAARASWDPLTAAPTDEAALAAILGDVLRPFGSAAAPAQQAIMGLASDEHDLLVLGKVNGVATSDPEHLSGMGYLEGWDTWDDVAVDLENFPPFPMTPVQPQKLGMVDMRTALITGGPDYETEVAPLLAAMETAFAGDAATFNTLRTGVPPRARNLWNDLADACVMTSLRATQLHGLYDYVAGTISGSPTALGRLGVARAALDSAYTVVQGREPSYRVEPSRIAAWRPNPTCYDYTYLWTVHSLYFWWRDERKAVDAPFSPFDMNIDDPVDVAFGENAAIPLLDAATAWGDQNGLGALVNGLSAPATEPIYWPNGPDDVRSRP